MSRAGMGTLPQQFGSMAAHRRDLCRADECSSGERGTVSRRAHRGAGTFQSLWWAFVWGISGLSPLMPTKVPSAGSTAAMPSGEKMSWKAETKSCLRGQKLRHLSQGQAVGQSPRGGGRGGAGWHTHIWSEEKYIPRIR